MIVVDSNILAYLYLPGEFTAAAESLLVRDAQWAAPFLWRSEFRNILAGYMRKQLLFPDHAYQVQREAEDLMTGLESEVDSLEVLELVRDSDCSAYDCEFVALAKQLNVSLVTMDRKLLRAFPDHAVSLTQALK